MKSFAKFISLLTIYQQHTEWDEEIDNLSKLWAKKELIKMKLPDGWESLGSYDQALEWFSNNLTPSHKQRT